MKNGAPTRTRTADLLITNALGEIVTACWPSVNRGPDFALQGCYKGQQVWDTTILKLENQLEANFVQG